MVFYLNDILIKTSRVPGKHASVAQILYRHVLVPKINKKDTNVKINLRPSQEDRSDQDIDYSNGEVHGDVHVEQLDQGKDSHTYDIDPNDEKACRAA